MMKSYYKRYLPHITPPGGTFFITVVLKNAIPISKLKRLKEEKEAWLKEFKKNENKTSNYNEGLIRSHKQYFKKIDQYLDSALHQEHYLKDPRVANILANKIKEYDGKYYRLEAYCIMSNHFHLLIDTAIQLEKLNPNEDITEENYVSLSKIMQFIKGGSAYEINKQLKRKGTFWQRESYDHLVRNEKEHYNILHYILDNPVKAGIVNDWRDFPHTFCTSDIVV